MTKKIDILIKIADVFYTFLFSIIALYAFLVGNYLQTLAALAFSVYIHKINSEWW
ncbi:hypothetical protein [Levilactobacillus wangkuiensis]|uniref:hypothetical protein n=1 Tax=Levilactobacillus wangkuiensis TaxID=2799566 RepID=UPI001944B8A6|nr:hypothetical protein [Levilactobacillus wangkuiensis]